MLGSIVKKRLQADRDLTLILRHEDEALRSRMTSLIEQNGDAAVRMGDAAGEANDWHDNAAYDASLLEMEHIDKVSKALGPMILNSEVIPYPGEDEREVTIGSLVSLADEVGAFDVYVVGQTAFVSKSYDHGEVELTSARSPLGLAILGAVEGDNVGYETPAGKDLVVTISSVRQLPGLPFSSAGTDN